MMSDGKTLEVNSGMGVEDFQNVGLALKRVDALTVEITQNVSCGDYELVMELLDQRGKAIEAIGLILRERVYDPTEDPGSMEMCRISGAMIKRKNDELMALIVEKRSVLTRKLIDVQNAKAYQAYLLQGRNHGH